VTENERHTWMRPHIKVNLAREFIRLLPIIGAGLVFLHSDTGGIKLVLYMIGILLLICAAVHLLRKVLFPYLDLKEYTDKALESPQSAGMVFLGISFIMGMTIYAATSLLK
jgi:hypothetical protein